MHKKLIIIVSGLLMLTSASAAFAERGKMYFGVDALNWTYTQKASPTGTGSATGIRGVFGQQFNNVLGWETQFGTGGSISTPAWGTVQMNGMGGAYLRANLPLGIADLHALIGYGFATYTTASQWVYRSGTSYGFGTQVKISEKMALRADYMQYISGSISESKAVTFGANFYF